MNVNLTIHLYLLVWIVCVSLFGKEDFACARLGSIYALFSDTASLIAITLSSPSTFSSSTMKYSCNLISPQPD
ncbi:hypothetical protein BGZ63DRAFT_386288 [Mariannaea sp. PMI_226]|nr:hypothetical protein BGZ63DRAFT_386288 [Mariannaea sp. PMI_226]